MSNAKYTTVAVRENYDDLGHPNNTVLALIDDNGDLMSNPKKGSTISSMENHRLHHDTPITYHVVKVNQSDSNVRNRIKRKLEEIDGAHSVSAKLYERGGYMCGAKITVCGDRVDPVTIIQTILRDAEILSYKIEKNPCDEAFNNHIQNEKPAAEDLNSKIPYAVQVVNNLCCSERLDRIKRELNKTDGINCVTVDYDQRRIEVSGDHVDRTTLQETIEKYAQIKPHRNVKGKPVAAAAQGFKNKKNFQFDETCVVKVPRNYWLTYYLETIQKNLSQEINGIKSITMNKYERTIAVCGDIVDPAIVIKTISRVCKAAELVSYDRKNSNLAANHLAQGRTIKNNDHFIQNDTKLSLNYNKDAIVPASMENRSKVALPLMEKNRRSHGPVACVLKVHCPGCFDEIRETLHKIKGVDFVFSLSKYGSVEWEVKVFGDIDPLTITNTILTKYKRTVTLSAYEDSRRPQKKPAGILQRLVSVFQTLCHDF
ncbi:hypothetical protein Pyn_08820 [Prunus yedoensis var. nudiflora]|uniref:Uncharacterized protein n=1 Tax=Prunus yedoensis var. nudiflora TaxID=2094558 RepID=A0A314Z9W0_PRUYE|nr:hypothetical protein Pyn_08820 [Prunus yedoensis var. nudiflora]